VTHVIQQISSTERLLVNTIPALKDFFNIQTTTTEQHQQQNKKTATTNNTNKYSPTATTPISSSTTTTTLQAATLSTSTATTAASNVNSSSSNSSNNGIGAQNRFIFALCQPHWKSLEDFGGIRTKSKKGEPSGFYRFLDIEAVQHTLLYRTRVMQLTST
jgi:hypothetical protein